MIDANGFVVYATKEEHVGRFFGEVEGAVMEQMISMNIFRKLSMYDYQAFSNESKTTNESRINFNSQASTSFSVRNSNSRSGLIILLFLFVHPLYLGLK